MPRPASTALIAALALALSACATPERSPRQQMWSFMPDANPAVAIPAELISGPDLFVHASPVARSTSAGGPVSISLFVIVDRETPINIEVVYIDAAGDTIGTNQTRGTASPGGRALTVEVDPAPPATVRITVELSQLP